MLYNVYRQKYSIGRLKFRFELYACQNLLEKMFHSTCSKCYLEFESYKYFLALKFLTIIIIIVWPLLLLSYGHNIIISYNS